MFFVVNLDKILYNDDMLGQTADSYKSIISFVSGFVVIIEPIFNFDRYKDFKRNMRKFEALTAENLKNVYSMKDTRRKILRKLTKIFMMFVVIAILCETHHGVRAMFVDQTRNIYLTTMVITIILYNKVWFIVYHMLVIEEYLVIIKNTMKIISQDLVDNSRLQSVAYDKIIHSKYLTVIKMYKQVQRLVGIFNSLGAAQLTVFLAIKLFLTGDFYWIALVTMHNRINMNVTFGMRWNARK